MYVIQCTIHGHENVNLRLDFGTVAGTGRVDINTGCGVVSAHCQAAINTVADIQVHRVLADVEGVVLAHDCKIRHFFRCHIGVAAVASELGKQFASSTWKPDNQSVMQVD